MKIDAFLNSKVGGYVALGVLGLAVVWYLKKKAGDVVNAVNPMNGENIVNRGATAVTDGVLGKGALANVWDHTYAAVDLINPFNDSDAYAKSVWHIPTFEIPEWSNDYINPASDKNVVSKAVNKVAGEGNVATAGDYLFGLIDLINPFNSSDDYAKKVYGVDEDYRVITNNNKEGIGQ